MVKSVDQDGNDQHGPAAIAVGQGAEQERSGHQAKQPCAEQGRQRGRCQAPFGADGGRNEADRCRVEAVDGNDQEA